MIPNIRLIITFQVLILLSINNIEAQDFLDELANVEVFKREYGFLALKNIVFE